MDSSRDIILYNPDMGEIFVSNEETIKQITAKINEILKYKTLTDEEIIKIIKGET
jgi:hypothetical protein